VILTVTPNTALDLTYEVPRLVPHQSHRVVLRAKCAGGKGINVARTLAELGLATTALGFAGGCVGAELRAELAAAAIPHVLCATKGETRRTVTVVSTDTAEATLFNETGPPIMDDEWLEFRQQFERLVSTARAVVMAGSVPTGLSADVYADLCSIAAAAGVPVVIDTDGTPLRHALTARPAVVKVNSIELFDHVGHDSHLVGARTLCDEGADSGVVSLGHLGIIAVTPEGTWHAKPPERLKGNPTGAGDAATAALVHGLVTGQSWPDRLRHAVAISAATVLHSSAGGFDAAAYAYLLDAVTVKELATR
jgi:tagatose 6-phosphate kinase